MRRMRRLVSLPLVAFLAVAIHVDWHVARPEHHRLSLEWGYHWLLGVAVFVAVAAYVVRRWPDELWEASAVNVLSGVVGGIVVIPLATELYYRQPLGGATADEWAAFAQFAAAGLLAYLVAVPLTVQCFGWLGRMLTARSARRGAPASVTEAASRTKAADHQ